MKKYDDRAEFMFLVFGVLLGAATVGAVFLYGGASRIAYSAREYDGIIGSFIALLGAAATVAIVNHQIQTSERRHLEDISDKQRAARSLLPLALSQVSQFAFQSAKNLSVLIEDDSIASGKLKAEVEEFLIPSLPSEAAQTLKENIEYAHHLDGDALSQIIIKVQIFYARLESLNRKLAEKSEDGLPQSVLDLYDVRGRIFDAIELHALVGGCFKYARGSSAHINENEFGGMANAAFNCGIYDGEYPGVWEILNSRAIAD